MRKWIHGLTALLASSLILSAPALASNQRSADFEAGHSLGLGSLWALL